MLRNVVRVKRYTPFHMRKQIAESLILSKLGYSNVLFDNKATHMKNGFQRVQNATASFAMNKYTKIKDVLEL